MANLPYRQLRGDQVVTVHLRMNPGMYITPNDITRNWITCPVNMVQELLRTVMSLRLVLVRGNPGRWPGTPPPLGWTPACLSFGGCTFWSTLPSLSSAQAFDATCLGSVFIYLWAGQGACLFLADTAVKGEVGGVWKVPGEFGGEGKVAREIGLGFTSLQGWLYGLQG